MEQKYGTAAYTTGYRVYTTIKRDRQDAAVAALRKGLLDYDRRHGYRGPEAHLELAAAAPDTWPSLLAPYQPIGGLEAVIVTAIEERGATMLDAHGATRQLEWQGLSWARPQIGDDGVGAAPKRAADLFQPGDVIRVQSVMPEVASGQPVQPAYWRLSQVPAVEGAMVSLDTHDGAVQSLVGGFDFARSKFNRVVQALRQPGSNFKPFVYSAALDNGFTPASFVNDAPIVFDAPGLDSAWRPENYTGTYYGPTRLRDALANSRNLVSIRLMRELGVDKVIAHVRHFGFDPKSLPNNLSLALGTGELTPMAVVRGYAAFANGGFLLTPYVIQRVETAEGELVETTRPATACPDCAETRTEDGEPADLEALAKQQADPAAPRAIDAQNAYMMYSMMKDVITRGTARRALELKRKDIAGKTGTTNDQKDAWFSGFNGSIVTTVWVGFDVVRPLGGQETGARAALPIWIDYMRTALKGTPETELTPPPGIVTVRIDPDTGALAGVGNRNAIVESFRERDAPRPGGGNASAPTPETPAPATEQLF
jgi:penicillin-binding protein 1A